MIATLSKKLLDKLQRKPYRDTYVAENVRTGLAYQIRALREQRGWSQKDLADRLDTADSVISRVEDPDYGRVTLKTILEIGAAFDVAVLVQYVSFPEMLFKTRDVSPKALEVRSFDPSQFSTANPIRLEILNHEAGIAPAALAKTGITLEKVMQAAE